MECAKTTSKHNKDITRNVLIVLSWGRSLLCF